MTMIVKLLIVSEVGGDRFIAKFTHEIKCLTDLTKLYGYKSDLPIFASIEIGNASYDPRLVNSINSILDSYEADIIYKDKLDGFCYIMKKLGVHISELNK